MMKNSFALIPMMMIAVLSTAEVKASSAGGGIYVPVKAIRSSAECPTGHCSSGATCAHCAKLGFACVDGATDAPCTANGGCYPKRPTFGHYEQKWRTWPGESVDSGATPNLAEEEDSLLKSYDPPSAEEEDQQAPPSIEESVDIEGAEISSGLPAVEIELPPLPQVAPELQPLPQQPAPNNFRQPGGFPRGAQPNGAQPNGVRPNGGQPNQRPPAPPFGLIEPDKASETQLPEFTTSKSNANGIGGDSRGFASPAGYVPSTTRPTSTDADERKFLQKVNHSIDSPTVKKNSPPALPAGLTSSQNRGSAPLIRRLPASSNYRMDKAIQPTAAFE